MRPLDAELLQPWRQCSCEYCEKVSTPVMERAHKENNWDRMTNADPVLESIHRLTCIEMMNAVKKIKLGKRLNPLQ